MNALFIWTPFASLIPYFQIICFPWLHHKNFCTYHKSKCPICPSILFVFWEWFQVRITREKQHAKRDSEHDCGQCIWRCCRSRYNGSRGSASSFEIIQVIFVYRQELQNKTDNFKRHLEKKIRIKSFVSIGYTLIPADTSWAYCYCLHNHWSPKLNISETERVCVCLFSIYKQRHFDILRPHLAHRINKSTLYPLTKYAFFHRGRVKLLFKPSISTTLSDCINYHDYFRKMAKDSNLASQADGPPLRHLWDIYTQIIQIFSAGFEVLDCNEFWKPQAFAVITR